VDPLPENKVLRSRWLGALLICVVVVLALGRVVSFDFINYDDPSYLTENPAVNGGLNLDSIRWALTGVGETNLWHPLTWLSLMGDVSIFGIGLPAGFHFTNLLLHLGSAVMLYLLLRRSVPESAWVAWICVALWAVHPQRVESVAWVSQRKDVLSGALFFTAWYAWEKWRGGGFRLGYWVALLAFAAASAAKPSVVPLPLVFCLSEMLRPRGARLAPVRVAALTAPFFAVAMAAAVLTIYLQRAGGLSDLSAGLPLMQRLLLIPVSLAWYLEKTIFPLDGKLWNYPPLGDALALGKALLVIVLAAAAFGFAVRKERRVALFAGGFLLLWLPVSGLIPVSFYFVSERYSYLPQALLIPALVLGLRAVTGSLPGVREIGRVAGIPLLVLAACMAFHRASFWKDSETRFRREMSVNPRSLLGPIQLGLALEKKGKPGEAVPLYERALEIDPESGLAAVNLGRALSLQGRIPEAIIALDRATRCAVLHEESSFALLATLEMKHGGGSLATREVLTRGLERFPKSFLLHREMGSFQLAVMKDAGAAEVSFSKALAILPDDADAMQGLGISLLSAGRTAEARKVLSELVARYPERTQIRELLGRMPAGG